MAGFVPIMADFVPFGGPNRVFLPIDRDALGIGADRDADFLQYKWGCRLGPSRVSQKIYLVVKGGGRDLRESCRLFSCQGSGPKSSLPVPVGDPGDGLQLG